MSAYLGDFRTGKTVRKMWNSNAIAGESITRATNGTVSVYKDGGTTQSTAGVSDTEDFDSLTGVHLVAVDTSADGTFYSAGSDFEVVLSGATIDGKTINATLFSFSLENRSGLMPTTDGRKVDVDANGGVEVGSFQADAITGAALAADAVTEIQSGLATQASVNTIDDFLDTEIATILAAVDTEVAAIKAKTDNLPATPAATGDQMALTAAAIDAILDEVVEGSTTLRQALRGFAAALLGKASGLATTTAVYRDVGDTKDRITATVDADGNRTAIVLDLS